DYGRVSPYPDGAVINYFRRAASLESGSGCAGSALAHRVIRNRLRHSGNLFRLPIAQPARAASFLTAGRDHLVQGILAREFGDRRLFRATKPVACQFVGENTA